MTEEPKHIQDVLIIGAGPCGFAVAARLREHTPSALFTDDEHNRYHWIAKHANRASIVRRKTGTVRCPSIAEERGPSILVLDSSGTDWMAKWHKLFAALEIKHLRSPMFFHPDPQDRDGLLAFAHGQGRACECVEIGGCVGQEISKHKKKKNRKCAEHRQMIPLEINERDREDYFTPGTKLFKDYCDCVAGRYGLCQDLIRNETVMGIKYHEGERLFVIESDAGTYYARAVVLAVGAGNPVTIPSPFTPKNSKCAGECAYHAFQSTAENEKTKSNKEKNVLVIGGGLTSAQVADRAVRYGNGRTKVWHLIRGPLKRKFFHICHFYDC
jgi:glycine/D-amino acid oxidase-like deaminating enzyme